MGEGDFAKLIRLLMLRAIEFLLSTDGDGGAPGAVPAVAAVTSSVFPQVATSSPVSVSGGGCRRLRLLPHLCLGDVFTSVMAARTCSAEMVLLRCPQTA